MKLSLDRTKKIKYTEILDFDLVMEVTCSFVFTSSGGRDDTYMNFLYRLSVACQRNGIYF